MKYEISIEIERTTISGHYSPKTSEVEKNNYIIEVEARELPNKTDIKLLTNPKLRKKMQNRK
jgi:hypothetical protein